MRLGCLRGGMYVPIKGFMIVLNPLPGAVQAQAGPFDQYCLWLAASMQECTKQHTLLHPPHMLAPALLCGVPPCCVVC